MSEHRRPRTIAEKRESLASSRAALLAAATDLFAQQGYEATTVREIGRRAEVDPTLIARYFGGKAELYLESMRRSNGVAEDGPYDLRDPAQVRALLDRVGPRGPSPTLYAAVRPHDDAELQEAAMGFLDRRVTRPVEEKVRAAGHGRSQLRAEIVTAALAGIVLSRTSRSMGELADAPSAEVAELVSTLLRGLIDEAVEPPRADGASAD
jgi:AcrR family transcriptional regulator